MLTWWTGIMRNETRSARDAADDEGRRLERETCDKRRKEEKRRREEFHLKSRTQEGRQLTFALLPSLS